MFYTHFISKMWRLLFLILKAWGFLREIQASPREGDENCMRCSLFSLLNILFFWNKCVWKLLALKQFFIDVYLGKFLSLMLAFLLLTVSRNYKNRCSDQEIFLNICYILSKEWRRLKGWEIPVTNSILKTLNTFLFSIKKSHSIPGIIENSL